MMKEAPSNRALAAAHRPTGPAPAMYTDEPGPTLASVQPWNPVGKMSERSVRSLILAIAWALSGNLSNWKSA